MMFLEYILLGIIQAVTTSLLSLKASVAYDGVAAASSAAASAAAPYHQWGPINSRVLSD